MDLEDSLQYKCIKLTGSFETGKLGVEAFSGLSGNFDGQGISFGALQWNFGQGSLQPLIKKFIALYPQKAQKIFKEKYLLLYHALDNDILTFAKDIQTSGNKIFPEWANSFIQLGQTPEMIKIQTEFATLIFNRACNKLKDINTNLQYPIESERAIALMFDIVVQNGGIRKNIQYLYGELKKDISEVDKLRAIANHVANSCKEEWKNDVLSRKMCIANGSGIVHKTQYNLEDYGIKITKAVI